MMRTAGAPANCRIRKVLPAMSNSALPGD